MLWFIAVMLILVTGIYVFRNRRAPQRLLTIHGKIKIALWLALLGLIIGIPIKTYCRRAKRRGRFRAIRTSPLPAIKNPVISTV